MDGCLHKGPDSLPAGWPDAKMPRTKTRGGALTCPLKPNVRRRQCRATGRPRRGRRRCVRRAYAGSFEESAQKPVISPHHREPEQVEPQPAQWAREGAKMTAMCRCSEIQDRFSGEWVLVGARETDENLEAAAGNLLRPSRQPRHLRPALAFVAALMVLAGCSSCSKDLVGRVLWMNDFGKGGEAEAYERPTLEGRAFLLLEQHYASVEYGGPQTNSYIASLEDARMWRKSYPKGWEWERTNKERLVGDGTELLLEAPLDAVGAFRFENVPVGRHSLFIYYDPEGEPHGCVGGPFEVLVTVESRKRALRDFYLNDFTGLAW